MSKVFITDYFDETSIESEVLGDLVSTEQSKDAQVLLVWHKNINSKYLDQFPNLIGVQRYGVGYDTLDVDEIKKRGLIVCNNPDYGVDEVSDTALAMILNISRGITKYNHLSKSLASTWQEEVIRGIKRTNNTTLGIVGVGRIGGSVALKARAVGFNVMIFDKYKERGHEKMLGVKRTDNLNDLLKQSDIISIHTPLTCETEAMVDEEFINNMNDGSSIVLTARGKILKDLDVVYNALKTNKLNSVALDVLPLEPPVDHPLINAWRNSEDWLIDRLIINNHSSYFSEESFREIRLKAAENAKRILDGSIPYNLI